MRTDLSTACLSLTGYCYERVSLNIKSPEMDGAKMFLTTVLKRFRLGNWNFVTFNIGLWNIMKLFLVP